MPWPSIAPGLTWRVVTATGSYGGTRASAICARMNPARRQSPSSSTRSANARRGVSSSGSAQMARYSASRESVIKSFTGAVSVPPIVQFTRVF